MAFLADLMKCSCYVFSLSLGNPMMTAFEGTCSGGEASACAGAVLATYDDAPVRPFILPLAHRHARDCLRTERCEFLRT